MGRKMNKLAQLQSFDRKLFQTPIDINLGLTTACNLNCSYCFLEHSKTPSITLPIEYIEKGINHVLQNRNEREITTIPSNINFMGGEPTLQKDLIYQTFDKFPLSHYPFFDYEITTNGTLLQDDIFLKAAMAQNMMIIVSYDGLFADGPKAGNNKGRAALQVLAEINYPRYGVSCVVEERGLPYLFENLIDLVKLKVPLLVSCGLVNSLHYSQETEMQYLDILFEAREAIRQINPEFLFLGQRPIFEPIVPYHVKKGTWFYSLHPTGYYVKGGIETFMIPKVSDKDIVGHCCETNQLHYNLDELCSYRQVQICDICDCSAPRCREQTFFDDPAIRACQFLYLFGDSLQTASNEPYTITGKQFPLQKISKKILPEFLYRHKFYQTIREINNQSSGILIRSN